MFDNDNERQWQWQSQWKWQYSGNKNENTNGNIIRSGIGNEKDDDNRFLTITLQRTMITKMPLTWQWQWQWQWPWTVIPYTTPMLQQRTLTTPTTGWPLWGSIVPVCNWLMLAWRIITQHCVFVGRNSDTLMSVAFIGRAQRNVNVYLTPLDTFGKQYCPRPTLRVSQLIHKITNLWKFRLNRSSESGENNRKTHPCFRTFRHDMTCV